MHGAVPHACNQDESFVFVLLLLLQTLFAIAGQHLHTLSEHTDEVKAVAAIGAGQLASGGIDRTIKIWVCAAMLLAATGYLHWCIGAAIGKCFVVGFTLCVQDL